MHVTLIYVLVVATILAVNSQAFTSMYLNLRWLSAAFHVLLEHYKFYEILFEVGYANEHFCRALLEFPWYERNVEFQKCYLTALKLYQKDYPFTICAYRAFIIQVAQLIICCVIQSAEARLRVYDDLLTECIAKVKKMGKFDRNDLFEFEKIIKYQRTFHSYNRELKQITEMGIIMHMIGVFVILLVTILAVGSQKFTSLYMNVRWLTTACYVLFLHYEFCRSFVKCGYAQEHFTIALLEFPWYERHVRFQKCYLMTLTLCQKDDPYTVWGLYEVNLKLFAANVNRLYSVVNLVLLKYK
ncbi:uncharacterized protein LOC135848888 isoform X2 [Planococcus citri]|uniref:uncharacterized protein LOC135848888 isoform X2 n=1 Tax=Planococcus citri TaxID=170843 RepID=UPI0031F8D429